MEINQTKQYALIDIFGQFTGVYTDTVSDAYEIAYDVGWHVFDIETSEIIRFS